MSPITCTEEAAQGLHLHGRAFKWHSDRGRIICSLRIPQRAWGLPFLTVVKMNSPNPKAIYS